MAILGQWSFADLTGNSQFVLVGSTLYIVGNTTTAGQFAIWSSTNYGITVTQVASYTFLSGSPPAPSPTAVEFDPAVVADSFGILHIIGTWHNPNPINPSLPGSDDVVKFTFDTNTQILSGPFTIVQGSLVVGQPAVTIGSDYDIVALPPMPGSPPTSGGTLAVVQIVDNVTYQEQVNSYQINASNQVVGVQTLASSPVRGGQAYDSVSLISAATGIEAYVTSHNKAITFTDIAFTLGVFTTPYPAAGSPPTVIAWTPQTVLYTLPVRHVDNRLTVIANGNSRWLSDTLYTQNRSGLSGNILLGYLHDITSAVPWSFNLFAGLPNASLVEPCINVFADNSTMLGFITRDLTRNPAVDGIISVNTLNVSNWQYVANPAFRNPNPFASWLRGTKSILPTAARWGFIGESRVTPGNSTFYSGFLVAPVADITPVAINPAFRGVSYAFDASASFDANFNTLEYEWNLQINTGTPFPAWAPNTVYVAGNKIADSNGNVQICVGGGTSGAVEPLPQWEPDTVYTLGEKIVDFNGNVQQVTTPGTSGTLTPSWNGQFAGTTGDGSVVWTNEGPPTFPASAWNIVIDGQTSDGSVIWATAIILIPNFIPNTQHTTAVVTIGDSIGPLAQSFQVQVGVVDLDSNNNPIHTPPTGTQLAQATFTLPFVPAPVISWPGPVGSPPIDYSTNPINNVPRNSELVLFPEITPGQSGLPLTYSWEQIGGTPVVTGNTTGPTLVIFTNGAYLNVPLYLPGSPPIPNPLVDGLVFQITVNDGVNSPVVSTVTVNVTPYVFYHVDDLFLARSNWVVASTYTEDHVIPASFPYFIEIGNPPGADQTLLDGGVRYTSAGSPPAPGVALTAVITPPITGQYNVTPTGLYAFSAGDAGLPVQIVYSLTQPATISQRNTPQTWTPLAVSGMLTDQTSLKRSTDLEGDTRILVISPAAVLVYGTEIQIPTSVPLRKLLVPNTDTGIIEDAVHTEADYTIVLTSTNNLYRYSVAPLINTDNPDTTIDLNNYVTLLPPSLPSWVASTAYSLGDEVLDSNGNVQIVIRSGVSGPTQPTWNPTRNGSTNDGLTVLWKNLGLPVVFNSIFSTDTFANVRVIALSGPNGCFLIQLDSTLFTVQGFFEISVESGLLYGADNVQWIRQANVESLHSGQILLGTLSDGQTYETLIDLSRRLVLGTWDASKLINQYVTTGEILFETESSYVGLPIAPVIQAVTLNPNNSATLTWAAERPDLITSYQVTMSIDGGTYNTLAYVGSGIVQTYTTAPLMTGHTYSFEVRSGGADGFSPYSLPVAAYIGIAYPPTPNQITAVSGPATGPFVVTLSWSQSSPGIPPVNGYVVQMSTDGGAFSTVATITGGQNQSYQVGPLASGHTYGFQIAATYNGIQTPYSNLVSITFPVGAEIAVPSQSLVNGVIGVSYTMPAFPVVVPPDPPVPVVLQASGGVPLYTWTLASGSLPLGLSLASDGTIAGTPTTPGVSTFTVTVTDSATPTPYTSVPSPTLSITIT